MLAPLHIEGALTITRIRLISSISCATAEVALGILRNITCVTNNEAITGLRDDELGEDRLLSLLEAQITGSSMGPTAANGARANSGSVAAVASQPERWSEQCAVEVSRRHRAPRAVDY